VNQHSVTDLLRDTTHYTTFFSLPQCFIFTVISKNYTHTQNLSFNNMKLELIFIFQLVKIFA